MQFVDAAYLDWTIMIRHFRVVEFIMKEVKKQRTTAGNYTLIKGVKDERIIE
jgi:hypothetical protein